MSSNRKPRTRTTTTVQATPAKTSTSEALVRELEAMVRDARQAIALVRELDRTEAEVPVVILTAAAARTAEARRKFNELVVDQLGIQLEFAKGKCGAK